MHRRSMLQGLVATAAIGAVGSGRAAPVATDRRADLTIVRRALGLHPGVFRYHTPATFERAFARLEREFLAAVDTERAFLALSRFLATLRCGHSYCNPGNQRRALAQSLFERRTRVPYEFRWLEGRMVVTRAYTAAPELPRGTVVERLNGLATDRLLAELMPYARADGGNDGKRRALLSMQGLERIETFDVFQGLLHPPRSDAHRLVARRPDGRRIELEVPALDLAQRVAERRTVPNDGRPIWSWDVRPDGIALLTMPNWAMYNSEWKSWREWLAERLASLDRARALIVDLRDNEGGNDCGDEILARLIDRDLPLDDGIQKLRFERTPPDLDPYLDTWDDTFRTLGVGARPLGDGWYERPGPQAETVIAPRGPRLRLPVGVLVGPVNSSATFQFANRGRRAGLLRLFGTETGGNLRGINGGCYFFVRLPASGIEFDLPLVGYFPSEPQPDSGVVPDVVVPETVADVAAGRDAALEAALAWARAAR